MKTLVKRASKGQSVQAEIKGKTVFGRIAESGKKHITIAVAGSSKPVKVARGEVFKATKDEVIKAEKAKGKKAAVGAKIPTQDYTYVPCRAASGKKSLDANDKVALMLRGKTLDESYEIGANLLKESAKSLKNRYNHLNLGQQRMCLGNLMRGAL